METLLVHEEYMQRCLALAEMGAGYVSPNPLVGSVIVYRGDIIGEGFHQQYGGPHAEVNAINHVFSTRENPEALLKEATLYVNLEPCAHTGKTPPCAELIIKHQIPRVIVGSRDPFKQVNGQGIAKLRQAGVEVLEGVLKVECDFLNRRFFTRIKQQRPYVILKWAQTNNLLFAPENGTQQWISGSEAKALTHQWRAEEDAILVGKNTALIDNPQLTVREATGKNPLRIVIDKNLELPSYLYLFDYSEPTIVFNAKKTSVDRNIKYLELENFDALLPQFICYQLWLMDIQSLIIEGGAKTINLFIEAGLWDEARIFTSPLEWETGIKSPMIAGELVSEEQVGKDMLHIIKNFAL